MSNLKKEAQDLWPPGVPRPKAAPVTPTARTVPVAGPNAIMPPLPGDKPSAPIAHKALTPVIDMQKAIKDLSREIAGEKFDPQSKSLIRPNENFNKFVGNHYVKSLEKTEEKDASEPTEPSKQPDASTQNIMQHLVGLDNNKMFRADGTWGPQTNSALENIYKFAYSLLQLAGDYGIQEDKIYNSTYLNGLKTQLSGYTFDKTKISLDPEEQAKRAESIIKHIHAIGRFYNVLRDKINRNPNLRSYIDQKKSFEDYTETGLHLTPEEDQFSQGDAQVATMPYAAPSTTDKRLNYIPIKALRSKKDYLDWMKSVGITNEEQAVGIFNSFIKSKIQSS